MNSQYLLFKILLVGSCFTSRQLLPIYFYKVLSCVIKLICYKVCLMAAFKGGVQGKIVHTEGGECLVRAAGGVVEADMLVPFNWPLDRNLDMRGIEAYRLCAGRKVMALILCSAQTLGRRGCFYAVLFYVIEIGLPQFRTLTCWPSLSPSVTPFKFTAFRWWSLKWHFHCTFSSRTIYIFTQKTLVCILWCKPLVLNQSQLISGN